MNAKYKFPILIGGLLILGLTQYAGFIPLAYKAAESDLFLVDTDDPGSLEATTNTYTDMAFKQCNDYIKIELGDNYTVTLPSAPINAWGLGNYEYLVNADVSIADKNSAAKSERYACRIQFDKKEGNELSDKENWSILGISGITEL